MSSSLTSFGVDNLDRSGDVVALEIRRDLPRTIYSKCPRAVLLCCRDKSSILRAG